MALVNKVNEIIEKAEAIELLAFYSQPAAAKALVKDDVVPVLLEMAHFIDNVKAHLLNVTELQKAAFLEIQQVSSTQTAEIEQMKAVNLKAAELQSEISIQLAALKKQVEGQKKAATKKPLPAVTA